MCSSDLADLKPLIALIIVLGVYPKPVIDMINPAVQKTLVQAHSTNPVPPHPANAVRVASATAARHTSGGTHMNGSKP